MLADWRVYVIARASGGLPSGPDAGSASPTFVGQDDWLEEEVEFWDGYKLLFFAFVMFP